MPTPRLRCAFQTGGLALSLLMTAASAWADKAPTGPKATSYMVAMRDGIKLATDVYLPGDGRGKHPVVVARTPYDKSKTAVPWRRPRTTSRSSSSATR